MGVQAQRRETSQPAPAELDWDQVVVKIAAVLAVAIFAPLAIAVGALVFVAASSRRLHWAWGLAPGVVGAVWALLAGPQAVVADHVAVYTGAWAQVPDGVAGLAVAQWQAWLVTLLPLSLVAGSVVGTGAAGYVVWRRAEWREDQDGQRARPGRARRQRRRIEHGKRQPKDGGLALGVDQGGDVVTLSPQQLAAHTLLLGATGAGKTVTWLQMAAHAIRQGRPVVAIDLKADPGVIDKLREEARAAGRRVYVWTPDGNVKWNPLGRGDPTRIKDKLMAGSEWTEPHYQQAVERYLQLVTTALAASGQAPTLPQVAEYVRPERLQRLAPDVGEDLARRIESYCDRLSRDQQSAIGGLESRLGVVTESTAGPWLDDRKGVGLDVYKAVCRGDVVVFSLPSGDFPSLASLVGGMALIDLQTVAAELQARQWQGQAHVFIDEFSALEGSHVLGLVARGRSAGMSVALATQELADLQTACPELVDQVLGNTPNKVIHRVDVPETAERMASLAGTRRTWQSTHQIHEDVRGRSTDQGTGLGSMRQVDEFVIHPNTIKTLPTGRCALVRKVPSPDMRLVDVVATEAPPHEEPSSQPSGPKPIEPTTTPWQEA